MADSETMLSRYLAGLGTITPYPENGYDWILKAGQAPIGLGITNE